KLENVFKIVRRHGIKLKTVVEWAEIQNGHGKRPRQRAINPIWKKGPTQEPTRTICHRHGAIQPNAIARGSVYIFAQTGLAKTGRGCRTAVERGGARLLRRDIEAKDRGISRAEDAQDFAVNVTDSDVDFRRTAQGLANRRTCDEGLFCCLGKY